MEFKKPNRYNNARPRSSVPERRDTPLAATTPTDKPPTPPRRFRRLRKVAFAIRSFIDNHKIISLIIMVVFVSIIILAAATQSHTPGVVSGTNNSVSDTGYQTVLPKGKTIKDLGGWERISPPESDPVYAYVDKIGDVSISVSEQPLPKTFTGDVEYHVAELAKKFNATNKVTAGDTTVYLGTSAKGPQSAIFIKINLLILIKSQAKISEDAWIKYVTSLTPTNRVLDQPGNSVSY